VTNPPWSKASAEARGLADALTERGLGGARIAVVLGSGLGAFARRLDRAREVAFRVLEGMPAGSVPGHAGRFVQGDLQGRTLLVQEGRVHRYEGRSALELGASVRAFADLGCRILVLTNASGGIRPGWKPPLLMRITDHLDRQGGGALAGGEGGSGSPYDEGLGSIVDEAAIEAGIPLERGVYAGLLGPAYETPAEVRMLAWMGVDAVGMSTVGEAQTARARGMRVVAISCVTNLTAGIGTAPLSHDDVLRGSTESGKQFVALLERAISKLGSELDEGRAR
jgi:purine-nucleoside phosphorylase